MHIIRTWIGVAAVAVALGACASAGNHGDTTSDAAGDVAIGAESIPVRVSNRNWMDIVVYAVHSGVRFRLGEVTSMNTQVLTIPNGAVSQVDGVQLVADPIGSDESYTTEPIMAQPGDAIEFNVEDRLAISNYSVGARSAVLSRRPPTPH